MYKGIVLVISDESNFEFISSFWDKMGGYELIKSDFETSIQIIKDENKANVSLIIFDEKALNNEQLTILEKGSFQKMCILEDITTLEDIQKYIHINKVLLKDTIKEIFILSIKEALKHYHTLHICKKQKKELDYLKSHNDKIQKFLIDSEKMISLGQQLAGVIHEINTPLGAIKSSSQNIKISLKEVLEKLPKLFEMVKDENVKLLFFKLLEHSATQTTTLSTREERKLKKELVEELEAFNLTHAKDMANKFAKIKIFRDIKDYLPIMTNEYSDFIFDTAYQMSDLQSNTDNISIAVEKSTKMIRAIKSYARYDHTDEMIKTSLKESLETVLTIYHNQIKQNIELIRDYDDLVQIYCYPDELNQVWTNLIHNALQAMDYKGVLTISLKENGNYQIVGVKDSGCGIPDDIKNKIFQAFFTTKPAGIGTGLGLDILKKIVDKHNGRIELDTEVGKGSEFRIYIPKILNIEE